jgi:DNA repair protein RadC
MNRENNDNWSYMISEVELVYKSKVHPALRPKMEGSESSYNLFHRFWDMNRIEYIEQFKVMYLNRANRVLAIKEISTGGLTGTIADPRVIISYALKLSATSIILCHNHPSGNLQPSRADETVTKRIKEGASLLDIIVMDHLIISNEGYFSFADQGLI